jgi:tRNA-Thr(GGU) m(6)t(6)A37 methyltransferase TsaA
MATSSFSVTPIGLIATPYTEKYHAPRQPGVLASPPEGIITLFPGSNFEQALEDLEGFERIWILSWFHRNEDWTPKVLPPRSGNERKGLFATRSPHRPNPIGISLCRLLEVRGRTLRVADPDLLDGTPIIDIKPYVPYADAFPESAAGWIDALPPDRERSFAVMVNPVAGRQGAWLRDEHRIHILDQASALLASHPSKRTKEVAPGQFVLAIKSWRVWYRVDERTVTILRLASGYAPEAIATSPPAEVHDRAAHEAFHTLWPPVPLPTT